MSAGSTFGVDLAYSLRPLKAALSSPVRLAELLRNIGWNVTLSTNDFNGIQTLLPIATTLDDLDLVISEIEQSGGTATAALIGQCASLAFDLMDAIENLKELDDLSIANLSSPLNTTTFWQSIAKTLPAFLLIQRLKWHHRLIYAVLCFVGVIHEVEDENGAVNPQLDWSALGALITNPVGQIGAFYGWPDNLDYPRLMDRLTRLAAGAGVKPRHGLVRSALSDQYHTPGAATQWTASEVKIPIYQAPSTQNQSWMDVSLLVLPVPEPPGEMDPKSPGLLVSLLQSGSDSVQLPLNHTWSLDLLGKLDTSGLLGAAVFPSGLQAPDGAPATLANWQVVGHPAHPWRLIGLPGGPGIEVAGLRLGFELDTQNEKPELVISVGFEAENGAGGLQFVLAPEDTDSFLQSQLGEGGAFGTDVAFTWSNSKGFSIEGAQGLSIQRVINLRLGAVTIYSISFSLATLEPNGLYIEAAVDGSFTLGPIQVSIDQMGLNIEFVPKSDDDGQGVFGPLEASVNFQPPRGLGLAIDGGPVSGGGFLYIFPETGEYNGVLDLDLFSIGISAVGLIDTKLPDGGWSMFLALFIDLPSIPLGFGFTLNGVGGVAGINRTLDVDGLRAAIRAGTLDSVLFPEDPIADAPIIIDTFKDIFPSAEGRYVFGPVIQIGWGSPTLIEAEIGVVVSLPDPITIAVLGSVTSILPTDDTDMVALHLEVAGIIDMASASLSIDASLHGSNIAGFPLSGDMALRSSFGDSPTFLMALGGCHPAFDRPPGMPDIERLSLAINAGSLIDIRFDCYFAITSNSLHFGAAFELTTEVEGFGIHGGAEFDALITFSPFSLRTGLAYHISVKAAGVDLMAVWLEMTLSGPNPWHVVGSATFTILGIDNTIPLDETIGSKKQEELPDSVDVLGQLRDALVLPEAWSIGAGGGQGVILSATDPLANELVVTPDGTLGITQKIVPLGITIDKSAPWQITGGYNRFDLEAGESGMASTGNMNEWFAVSSYIDLKPSERLSAPSFEQLKSGMIFGGGDPTAGKVLEGTLDFDQSIRDPKMREENEKLADTYNVKDDPRKGSLTDLITGQVASGFSIAADEIPQVVKPGYAVTNRVTGEVVVRSNRWTVSRASTAGRKKSTVVVPTWEVES